MTLQEKKEILLETAEKIGETASHLTALQGKAEQLISRTAGFWESEAASIFRNNCKEQGEEFHELLSRMQNYEAEILKIAGIETAAPKEEKAVLILDSSVLDDL